LQDSIEKVNCNNERLLNNLLREAESVSFDKKFGADFLASVPLNPGVYRFYSDQTLQYVGKAKSLRTRLAQYKNASRKKKDRRHRIIVKSSNRILIEVCKNEHQALLLENKIIQIEKPQLNIAGAFVFLYPCIGLRENDEHIISIVYTTTPKSFPHYTFYGSFRSRSTVKLAFQSLTELLSYLGHPERVKVSIPYSSVRSYRRIPKEILVGLSMFMDAKSDELLGLLTLQLLDLPSARQNTKGIQDALDSIAQFYQTEVLPLQKAKEALKITKRFIDQEERDSLFISANAQG
jgi:excinuclease ABC subunit C